MWTKYQSEGVAWIIEELSMNNHHPIVEYIWENIVSYFREELIDIMKKSNPEIFEETVKPILQKCGEDWNKNI